MYIEERLIERSENQDAEERERLRRKGQIEDAEKQGTATAASTDLGKAGKPCRRRG